MKEKIKIILISINRWKVILAIFLIGMGLFYWYQIRPSQIYSVCHHDAIEGAKKLLKTKSELGSDYEKFVEKELYLKNDYDYIYKQCLRKKGINK